MTWVERLVILQAFSYYNFLHTSYLYVPFYDFKQDSYEDEPYIETLDIDCSRRRDSDSDNDGSSPSTKQSTVNNPKKALTFGSGFENTST